MRFLLVLTSAVVTAAVLAGCVTWWLTDNVGPTTDDAAGGFATPPSSQSPAPYISEAPMHGSTPALVPGGELLTQSELQEIINGAVATYGGTAAVAFSTGSTTVVAGDDTAYPAWSTVKVPIAIAALRADPSHFGNASAAITVSDNDAAAALWQSLPAGAADAILSQADIPLTINTVKSRPEFSTFGQTPWSTSLQAKFAANLCLVPGSSEIVNLMAQVAPDQSYGLGTLPGSRFKGGWGPTPQGAYQVRQFGLATASHGDVTVALTTSPASGEYSDAQAMATMIARELSSYLDRLPATNCGR